MQNFSPYVIEKTANGERSLDIYSRLLQDRIVLLGTQVTDQSANAIVAQLLYLQQSNPEKDIEFYINSPGGSVTAGMGIYDTIQMLSCKVNTTCVGMAASMGAVLLSGGTGLRSALPNSRIMIHQPLGGAQGQASDVINSAKELVRWRDILCKLLSNNCKQKLSKIEKDCDRDYYMTAEEALKYGIIDKILGKEIHSK